jgi:hypothetical protein
MDIPKVGSSENCFLFKSKIYSMEMISGRREVGNEYPVESG